MNASAKSNKNVLSLKPIPLARFSIPKPRMLLNTGFGEDLYDCYAYVWLIKGASQVILIDGGVEPEEMIAAGTRCEQIGDLEEGLKKEGLSPEDVEIIILTHLHHDHMVKCSSFPRARLIVQEKELEIALSTDYPRLVNRGYLKKFIRPLFEAGRFETVNGDIEVEPGINTILTPGHTVGGQSVVLQAGDKKVIVTGFCCVDDNFTSEEPGMDVTPIGIYVDIFKAYESIKKVKAMADIVIPCHSKKFLEAEEIS